MSKLVRFFCHGYHLVFLPLILSRSSSFIEFVFNSFLSSELLQYYISKKLLNIYLIIVGESDICLCVVLALSLPRRCFVPALSLLCPCFFQTSKLCSCFFPSLSNISNIFLENINCVVWKLFKNLKSKCDALLCNSGSKSYYVVVFAKVCTT